MSRKTVKIYTDGSCLRNPGPGGWAAVLVWGGVEKYISGRASQTTNNLMELEAVIQALKMMKKPRIIEIFSDSKYVCDAFRQGWLKRWKSNGWKTSSKKPVKNQESWKRLDKLVQQWNPTFNWIPAHSSIPLNETVDTLANKEALIADGLIEKEKF